MKPRDLAELLLLAAIWGASFMFMRASVADFGPVPLIFVRVALATAVLLPIVCWRGEAAALRTHWRALGVVGLTNSALPFFLFAWGALSLTAGFEAVLNATTPLWTAVVAFAWLGVRLTRERVVGLLIGFAGVVVLVWDKLALGAGGGGLAVLAVMAAPACYGVAANYSKQRLVGVSPLVVATGSQLAATVMLAPFAWWHWPGHPVGWQAWGAGVSLAIACTALAYLMYFRLIAHVGPSKAVSVTFLIPLFAIVWGGLVLGETVTAHMLAGGAIILLGTALALGLWQPRWLLAKSARMPR